MRSSPKGLPAMEFDHLGVFVKTLEQGRAVLEALVPIALVSDAVHDPLLKVSVQFLCDTSGIRYEIVAPNGQGNPVDAVLSEQRGMLNHVAYRVKDFDAQVARLREAGCMPLGEPRPAVAFGGRRVVFFLSPLRMILELIEAEPGSTAAPVAR
jgi:methylmalonyl-CoA/ethylmalonyl-CoA epimerase